MTNGLQPAFAQLPLPWRWGHVSISSWQPYLHCRAGSKLHLQAWSINHQNKKPQAHNFEATGSPKWLRHAAVGEDAHVHEMILVVIAFLLVRLALLKGGCQACAVLGRGTKLFKGRLPNDQANWYPSLPASQGRSRKDHRVDYSDLSSLLTA